MGKVLFVCETASTGAGGGLCHNTDWTVLCNDCPVFPQIGCSSLIATFPIRCASFCTFATTACFVSPPASHRVNIVYSGQTLALMFPCSHSHKTLFHFILWPPLLICTYTPHPCAALVLLTKHLRFHFLPFFPKEFQRSSGLRHVGVCSAKNVMECGCQNMFLLITRTDTVLFFAAGFC